VTTAETINGVVEARNERGIKVLGEWRNLSKFKPLELPEVGVQVRLGLDPKGFITTLEVLDDPKPVTVTGFIDPDGNNKRLAVLTAAAHFAANRSDVKSGDVLRIADSWLQWLAQ
jgi:hypothetical protein